MKLNYHSETDSLYIDLSEKSRARRAARNVEARRARQAFVVRGLASAARARKARRYVTAGAVMRKLSRRLAAARSK